MRTVILLIVTAFLSACNSSDDDSGLVTKAQLPPAASTAALRAEVTVLEGQMKKLTLEGKVNGIVPVIHTDVVRAMAMQGEPTLRAAVSFGPCPDMGVKVGDTNAIQDPDAGSLSAAYQAFKTCTGYLYEVSTVTGNIKAANRIFWDGPNCTGNLLEWEAGGAGYNTQTLKDGVVFLSPVDDSTQLMVTAGQTPVPTFIQSVMLDFNHVCQSDIETQPMYQVTSYSLQTTGVATGSVGLYSLASP